MNQQLYVYLCIVLVGSSVVSPFGDFKRLTIKVFQMYILYTSIILLFTSNSRYELRSESRCHLAQPNKKSYYSNLTIQSISTPIWNNIPEHMKSAQTVNTFINVKKASFLYKLNRYIYNYHKQSNCVPVIRV